MANIRFIRFEPVDVGPTEDVWKVFRFGLVGQSVVERGGVGWRVTSRRGIIAA
jgi:hypothetical protein